MKRNCFTALILVGCFAVWTGCARPPVEDPEKMATPGTTEPMAPPGTTEPTYVARVEPTVGVTTDPSVRYVPMDAPEGTSKAVVVGGHALAYTRQLLPLGADGKLIGEGSAEQQLEQVLADLHKVLAVGGSGMDRLIRVHVSADKPETVGLVLARLKEKLPDGVRPALSSVVTPLPIAGALVGIDAVAVSDEDVDAVVLKQCEQVAGSPGFADIAVLPRGGTAYLSGQPDKNPRIEATNNSLDVLMNILEELRLSPVAVAQIKVFVDSAPAADEVRAEIEKRFPDTLAPPLVFVEWISSAPIEIELVAALPLDEDSSGTVRFFVPQGVKASPVFSPVALVETDRQIFISGLSSKTAGDGESQIRDIFAQLNEILAETKSDLRHLGKATYYVSDDDASNQLNKLRPDYYDPKRPPAASKVMIHEVGSPDRSIEIDMTAVVAP